MFELLDKISNPSPVDCEFFASKAYEGVKAYECNRANGFCLSPDCQQCGPIVSLPEGDEDYQVGKIVYATWGYEQTNVNFFVITKRTAAFVTLQPIGSIKEQTAYLAGKCTPNPKDVLDEKPIRRKLAHRDGKVIGCSFRESYGWISAWHGNPVGYSEYA